MISSAAGSIWRVSAVMIAVEREILPELAIHSGERVGVGLHLVGQALLHHRRRDDGGEALLEFLPLVA